MYSSASFAVSSTPQQLASGLSLAKSSAIRNLARALDHPAISAERRVKALALAKAAEAGVITRWKIKVLEETATYDAQRTAA